MILRFLILIVAAWAVPALCDEERAKQALRSARRASRSATYSPPSARELALAEKLFRRALSDGPPEDCSRLAADLGLKLEALDREEETVLVISEARADELRGWGTFAFRRAPSDRQRGPIVLLQSPHSRADRLTGRIAQRLFLETAACGVAFNGAGRHAPERGARGGTDGGTGRDGDGRSRSRADVAHSEANLFQALTRAFAAVHPRGLIVQVHGFSQDKRRSAAGRAADIVISDGSGKAPAWMRSLEQRLESSLAVDAALYPDEVQELGGTTNCQAIFLRASDGPRFLHLELSLPLRQRLLRESELPRRLARCWLD